MTLNQFLERLAQTPRGWELKDQGIRLRNDIVGTCPLSYLQGYNDHEFLCAASELGIVPNVAASIAEAADFCPGSDPTLTRRLLYACGLSLDPEC